MSTANVLGKQKLWGSKVVVHLFLVGLAAGMYITGSVLDLLNPGTNFEYIAKLATSFTILLSIIGVIFVLSHLGRIANAKRAFMRPGSSWLARGNIALLVFIIISLVQFVLWIWPSTILKEMDGLNSILQIINVVIAIYILLYTGMILATLKSFPFWHSWSLPLLFIISGLTAGLMLLILLVAVFRVYSHDIIIAMVLWNSILLLALALALLFFLLRGSALPDAKDSVRIITANNRLEFYIGAVTIGLLIPFILGIVLVFLSSRPSAVILTLSIVLTVIGLIGNYILKNLIVKSATNGNLNVQDETVPLPETARNPASRCVSYR
jgi:formate-dependent nitrite reductase membrane component NrfD